MSLFSNVEPVRFEGADTKNEFAYRVYEKDRVVLGKRMEDWLKVAVCYWHSFNWPGADIFGGGTLQRPWIGLGEPGKWPTQARSCVRFLHAPRGAVLRVP